MLRPLLVLFVVALGAGCSCSTPVTTPDAPRADSALLDVAVADDAPAADVPAMDAPAVGDAPAAGDAPSSADAPVASDGNTSATITIRDPAVYGNCFGGPPDPILAFWTVDVSGAVGPTATLTSATLTLTGGVAFTQTLTVDMPIVTLSGGSGSVDMRKTAGAPIGTPGCSACGEPTQWKLDLVFSVDGATVPITVMGDYDCVF